MYAEDNFLPLSGLQHMAYCPRQFALIHIEREWDENAATAKGRLEHGRLDAGYREFRKGRKQISGLHVRSEALGVQGRLDVLELELTDPAGPDNLPQFSLKGSWQVRPVEFKHGQPKETDCDRIQLCAQTMCLEEMLSIHISEASLFYQRIRRREEVTIDQILREKTGDTARQMHALFEAGRTPGPVNDKRCKACSLKGLCLPKKMGKKVIHYKKMLFEPEDVV